MKYESRYQCKEYMLGLSQTRGVVYKNNKLLFLGNRATAICMFCGYVKHPEMNRKFKGILDQRNHPTQPGKLAGEMKREDAGL